LIAAMIYTAIPIRGVVAGIVSTDELIETQMAADSRDKVSSFLAREDVRRQMETMGVDPSQIESRLATLSDSEVRYLAQQIDQMPAGQGAIGLIIVIGIVVVVVLLITDIIGVTNVFNFVNKPANR
jgi:hypothetical protein